MAQDQQTVTSPKYAINWQDFLRGLLLAAITSPLTLIEASLEAGELNFDWRKIGTVAITAAVGYLLKNYFTPASLKTPIPDDKINLNLNKAAK